MAINGNNILIYVNGSTVAATRSNEIVVNHETIEIASPSSGEYREYIVGRTDWSLTVSFLVTNYPYIVSMLLQAKNVSIMMFQRGSQNLGIKGNAIVQSCKMTFTRGNLAQGSLQLRGNGALTEI